MKKAAVGPRRKWALALMGFLFSTAALVDGAGQPGTLGLGFELGDPVGFNAKYWLTEKTALDFVLGWNSLGYRRAYYHDDRCYNYDFRVNNPNRCYDYRDDGYRWDQFHFHIDYLAHRFDIIRANIPIPIFFGAGVQYEYRRYWEDISWLGARGSFGIAMMPKTIPFDFFFELAPVLYVLPGPDFGLNGGLGARFWF